MPNTYERLERLEREVNRLRQIVAASGASMLTADRLPVNEPTGRDGDVEMRVRDLETVAESLLKLVRQFA